MAAESATVDASGRLVTRSRRGIRVVVAAAAFTWFFIGVMLDPNSAFWLMPVGVAVAAFTLGVLLPFERWRFVWMLCLGLAIGLLVDLGVRGLPLLLISERWDWLSAVFISTAIGCIAGILGGAFSTLAVRLFRLRPI